MPSPGETLALRARHEAFLRRSVHANVVEWINAVVDGGLAMQDATELFQRDVIFEALGSLDAEARDQIAVVLNDWDLAARVVATTDEVLSVARARGWDSATTKRALEDALALRAAGSEPGPGESLWESDIDRIARNIATATDALSTKYRALAHGKAVRWISKRDDRVRPTHRVADGQVVRADSYFQVGGYLMEYPADPSGPPQETQNCRCVLVIVDPVTHRVVSDAELDAETDAAIAAMTPARLTAAGEAQVRAPKGSDIGGQWIDTPLGIRMALDEQGRANPDDLTPEQLRDEYRNAIDKAVAPLGLRTALSIEDDGEGTYILNGAFKPLDGGPMVGNFTRLFRPGTRDIEHEVFELDPEWQGKGVGSAMTAAADDLYRQLGFERVFTLANIDVGGYTWAKQGFEFASSQDAVSILSAASQRFANAGDVESVKAITALVDREVANGSKKSSERPTLPATILPSEIAMIGWTEGATTWPGKEAMLGSSWQGIKHLVPEEEQTGSILGAGGPNQARILKGQKGGGQWTDTPNGVYEDLLGEPRPDRMQDPEHYSVLEIRDKMEMAVGTVADKHGLTVKMNAYGGGMSHNDQVAASIFTKDGTKVGTINRYFDKKTGTVYNDIFTLKPAYQGKGLGSEMSAAMEDAWREMGFEKVQVHANIDVGGYTWARAGFKFAKPQEGLDYVKGMEMTCPPEHREELGRLVEKGTATLPADLAMVGWTEGATTWYGKEWMLGSTWQGEKDLWLDDEESVTAAGGPEQARVLKGNRAGGQWLDTPNSVLHDLGYSGESPDDPDRTYFVPDTKGPYDATEMWQDTSPMDSDFYTAAQQKAAEKYASGGFLEFNGHLRGDMPGTARTEKQIRDLDSAIAQSPIPKDSVFYRGIPGAMFEDPESMVGKVIKDKGFLSTSSDRTVAERFAYQDGTILRIIAPEGHPALYLGPAASYPEEEWLFGRDTPLAITGVSVDDQGRWVIDAKVAEEVDPEDLKPLTAAGENQARVLKGNPGGGQWLDTPNAVLDGLGWAGEGPDEPERLYNVPDVNPADDPKGWDTEEHLDRVMLPDDYTEEEVEAIKRYTRWGSSKINGYAREGGDHLGPDVAFEAERDGGLIDSAIGKTFTPNDLFTYRGTGGFLPSDPAALDGLVGQVVRDKGFLSSSAYPDVAKNFADRDGSRAPIMKIAVPGGTNAIWANPISASRSERELLLGRDTPLAITGWYTDDQGRLVLEATVAEEVKDGLTAAGDAQARILKGNPGGGQWTDTPGQILAELNESNDYGLPYPLEPNHEGYEGGHKTGAVDWESEGSWAAFEAANPEGAKVIRDATERLKGAIPAGELTINIETEALEEFLRDGRMLGWNEVDPELGERLAYDRGEFYSESREQYERYILGVPEGQHPIYGWLNGEGLTENQARNMDTFYGSNRIVLKDKTKDRTSITVGDSLDGGWAGIPMGGIDTATGGDWARSGMGEWAYFANRTGSSDVTKTMLDNAAWDYIEAQIHGGVTLDDVERVDLYEHSPQWMTDELDRLGIPWTKEKRP